MVGYASLLAVVDVHQQERRRTLSTAWLPLHQNRPHLLQMLRQHVLVRHNRGVVR